MAVVTLKNGAEENTDVVALTMGLLRELIAKDYIAFYELVKKCREPNHTFHGNSGNVLTRLKLVEPKGSVNKSVRNIVLSAIVGDGMGLSLSSPIKAPIAHKLK